MQQFTKIEPLRSCLEDWHQKRHTAALVPTMGNLHAGHLQLVKQAQQLADKVVVSIFVNPTQFGADEDFDTYPRTIKKDISLLQAIDVDMLFHPEVDEMYPIKQGSGTHLGLETQVIVSGLNDVFCGKSRPGHFNGVTTVVSKLFNIIQPDIALFGQKDYQQLLLIKKLAADLCLPIKIAEVETIRETSGLALSSRNRYLDKQQKVIAVELYKTLSTISVAIETGRRDYQKLEDNALVYLQSQGFKVEYLNICNAADLGKPTKASLIVLAAVWLDSVRLIDNIHIKRR